VQKLRTPLILIHVLSYGILLGSQVFQVKLKSSAIKLENSLLMDHLTDFFQWHSGIQGFKSTVLWGPPGRDISGLLFAAILSPCFGSFNWGSKEPVNVSTQCPNPSLLVYDCCLHRGFDQSDHIPALDTRSSQS
jgi:hypothetical protein